VEHFLDFSIDFSMAFGFLQTTLTFFVTILSVLPYQHACKLHAKEFDKLLRALTASVLNSWVLTCDGVTNVPHAPVFSRPYSLGAPCT